MPRLLWIALMKISQYSLIVDSLLGFTISCINKIALLSFYLDPQCWVADNVYKQLSYSLFQTLNWRNSQLCIKLLLTLQMEVLSLTIITVNFVHVHSYIANYCMFFTLICIHTYIHTHTYIHIHTDKYNGQSQDKIQTKTPNV